MIYQQLNLKESITLTQEQYDALSTAEKNNGTIYFISDSSGSLIIDASEVSAYDAEGAPSNVQDVLDELAEGGGGGSAEDIVEGYYYNGVFYEEAAHTTPITGEAGKIYVDLSTEKIYRYGSSTFIEVSPSVVYESKTAVSGGTDTSLVTTGEKYTWNQAEANIQSDWNQTNTSADDYIKNKPTIPTVPTNVSAFTNDAGYLTSFTETDPTVPSWAKASNKPSYNFSEIGSTPTTLGGYGITDARISNGTITLGSDTITPITDISGKVDKVSGKGLSTEDYTTAEKNKLDGIATGAEVNVQSDWNESDSASDAYIQNKPTVPVITSTTATLTTNGWSNNAQTVNVTGVTASNNIFTSPATASKEAFIASGIWCSAQAAGTLTFICEETPEEAITVNITIMG